jgi:hypothetical protein
VYGGDEQTSAPESMRDGVWLTSPIDLYGAHRTAVADSDAESLAALEAYEALLAGMLNSDGVVVFSNTGRILGYKIFLKPNEQEQLQVNHRGGGRRRTFDLMTTRLGVELAAALFRSQDGETDCVRASK